MATRAERFRADQQRHLSTRAKKRAADHATKKARAKRKDKKHENVRAGKKASYALEQGSRRSTRGSANRARADVNLVLRAERGKRSPTARARSGK